MAEFTLIPWCHHTFNPWIGCFKVSPGCENCYAAVDHPARIARAQGRELWGRDAERKIKAESGWDEPLRWDRAAAKAGERRRVFCASQADVFEDRPDLEAPRVRLFHLINDTRNLDWLLLTKRPENVRRFWGGPDCPRSWAEATPPNLWLGVTAENQEYADRRIPILLGIPAAVRFVSAEPLLGAIALDAFQAGCCVECGGSGVTYGHYFSDDGTGPCVECDGSGKDENNPGLDWVIAGGESGPNARPFDLAWARFIRDQCSAAGVAFFMKQLGARPVEAGEPVGVRHKAGADPAEWPADLCVREFPGP